MSGLRDAITRRLERFATDDVIGRLWSRDPSLWTDEPDEPELADRLGWLRVGAEMQRAVQDLQLFADEVRRDFDRVVLLGMGGSSLAPEVIWRTFGRQSGYPSFHMLDSTHPRAVAAVEESGRLERTLFIVASKSGTTLETLSFYRYFWRRTGGRGSQFVAITDPDTPLERLAREQGFRRVFLNPPDIGGRYSALSLFGLVPAALMGVDPGALLSRGEAMAEQCGADVPPARNPGAWLGAVMGEAAVAGRNKLTFLLSPGVASFGLWVEQLIAESTGKSGKGIVPVVDEPSRRVSTYGADRLFVTVSLAGEVAGLDERARRLAEAGHPVVRIVLRDAHDLAAEFFCWEFATAVAGSVLRVNPFDQPNVAESKQNTKRVLDEGSESEQIAALRRQDVSSFLEGVAAGDYVALLAYANPDAASERQMRRLRAALGDRIPAPVTGGYGPRYLHSTGQLHKGGPQVGHFIQVLEPTQSRLGVPGEPYTFDELVAAQAQGDYQALLGRRRPVLRVSDAGDLLENL